MKTVLVTAVGGDIGYGIVRALRAADYDLRIIGCDIRDYNASRDLVDVFHVCPPYRNATDWLAFIRKALKEESCDYLWPVSEPEIRLLPDEGDSLSPVRVVMNTPEVLDVALDKKRTADFLLSHDIKAPATVLPGEDVVFGFPRVLKEREGYGSHGVEIARDEAAQNAALERMRDPVIQEYVGSPGEEYTMTVFSDGDCVNHIAFRRTLGFGGMSRYVELVQDEALFVIAERIAGAFHLQGSVNVQLRKQGDDYYVFEINPRISSTIGFRRQLGFNDVLWWLDLLEGRKIAPYIAPEGRIHGARVLDEKLFFD